MKIKATVLKIIDEKTCKCISSNYKKHALYGKYVMVYKKYLVDCADVKVKEGDNVEISSTRPISKRKAWKVSSVI